MELIHANLPRWAPAILAIAHKLLLPEADVTSSGV